MRERESESNEGEQEAVVCVRRSSWDRVTEMEPLVGKFSVGSLLPQYLEGGVSELWRCYVGLQTDLITAILTGAKVLARCTSSELMV